MVLITMVFGISSYAAVPLGRRLSRAYFLAILWHQYGSKISLHRWTYVDTVSLFRVLPLGGRVAVTLRGHMPAWTAVFDAMEEVMANDGWDLERHLYRLTVSFVTRPIGGISTQRIHLLTARSRMRLPVPAHRFSVFVNYTGF